jgi:hypothetical protein
MNKARRVPLLSRQEFARRMLLHAVVAAAVIAVALSIGVTGYHITQGLALIDALLEASMILSGMGPIHEPTTTAAKLFAAGYALFSGVILLGLAALILAPVMHLVLHQFHLDEKGSDR